MMFSRQDAVLDAICGKVRAKHPEPCWYDFIISGALRVANNIEGISDEGKAIEGAAAVLVSAIDMLKSISENRFNEELRKT